MLMIKPAKPLPKKIAVGFLVVGVLLFVTWLLPITRPLWDAVDLAIYGVLNGMLGDSPKTDWYWEFSNKRIFDKLGLVCYAGLSLKWIFSGIRQNPRRRMMQLAMAVVCIIFVRLGVEGVMDVADYSRRSPSMIVKTSTQLDDIFPETTAKFASKNSFPGDHALVAVWVMICFLLFAKPRYAGFAIVLTMIATLPRLVVGAHWFTDVVIGGLGFSLIGYGLFLITGLYERGVTLCEVQCLRLEERFGIKVLTLRDGSDDRVPTRAANA